MCHSYYTIVFWDHKIRIHVDHRLDLIILNVTLKRERFDDEHVWNLKTDTFNLKWLRKIAYYVFMYKYVEMCIYCEIFKNMSDKSKLV